MRVCVCACVHVCMRACVFMLGMMVIERKGGNRE